ncbi:restriction endonuclease subunit S [Avibacterium paragallinarum]|uniref:restriction endonuclease subunit S n=1 Tax=Avibacterium paragallinarum TaxID=728 RepID=UPI0039784517
MKKLANFIRIQNGYAFKSSEFSNDKNGIPVIKIGNITGGNFVDLSSYQTVSNKLLGNLSNYLTKDNDILIAMTGANVGKVSRVAPNERACFINQRVGRILIHKDCEYSSDFIYYLLSSSKSYQYFSKIAYGAAQPNISGKLIEDLDFPEVSIKQGNKAAELLRKIDQKILLNTQTNQTLEQIAQGIFKHWFIDFAPVHAKANALARGETTEQAELAAMACLSGKTVEKITALKTQDPTAYHQLQQTAAAFPSEFVETEMGKVPKGWKVKPLPEIFDFLEGPGIRNWQYTENEDGIKFINIRCINNDDLSLNTANKITKEEAFGKYKHFQLAENDIVISTSGTLGKTAIVRQEHLPLCLNTSVIRFRTIENISTFPFLYGFVKTQLQIELDARASGSVQRNFGPTHLKQISLLVPNFELLKAHQSIVQPLFEKRKNNLSQNDNLSKTRDELLPRLLSGEIKL